MPPTIIERNTTDAEYTRMMQGFTEHSQLHGNPPEKSERFGFVALDGDTFIGCSSGMAYLNADRYCDWFYLSDLFVEQPHRGAGLGRTLLTQLEQRIAGLGITHIWTWTAGHEAPGFYQKMGYQTFFEMPNYYTNHHPRIGLFKKFP